jgi:ribosomal protein S6--L-glutamate ligase
MLPSTFVAYGLPDLTAHAPRFPARQAVVSKRDQAHLGQGVSLWPSLEALHSLGALQGLPFPLVIQPFLDNARDLRVVVVGDYVEAYERVNPHGFRKNIFQGGSSRHLHLGPQELDFCRRVMARGQFVYAILDVLVSPDGLPYLSEISLKGGLTGSRLGQTGFREQVKRLEEEIHRSWAGSSMIPG